ncbi:MAG: site-specific DNA-methyltransferase, partial [Treponema sp.]|nr:site-specific DNA-methyltransferase [Treponema sp.]
GGFFSGPKPVRLLQRLMTLANLNSDSIIVDFFSGSASTAHAVMKINQENNVNRKFIMVQLPHACDEKSEAFKAGYKNICEIGKERIRRAGTKIIEEAKANKDMFSEENPFDIGFKVYRMQESNFKEYTPVQGQDENATKSLFEEFENNQIPLVDGWKAENVLTEIILKQGFALDCDCKKVNSFTKNTVYCIKDSVGPASRTTTMYVCLDSQIDSDTINNLSLDEKEKFVCLNNAIDDTSYARLADKGRIETI